MDLRQKLFLPALSKLHFTCFWNIRSSVFRQIFLLNFFGPRWKSFRPSPYLLSAGLHNCFLRVDDNILRQKNFFEIVVFQNHSRKLYGWNNSVLSRKIWTGSKKAFYVSRGTIWGSKRFSVCPKEQVEETYFFLKKMNLHHFSTWVRTSTWAKIFSVGLSNFLST